MQAVLAQTSSGLSATGILYITLAFIFLTGIITAVATKWSRDKCLRFFNHYHITLEGMRGHARWGNLKVFSSGVEIVHDHAYVDHRGRKKTSYMIYQNEMDQQILGLFRYHDELTPDEQQNRLRQIQYTFNLGPIRRTLRGIRNVLNTLRDAFNTAIGAVVGQYQNLHPGSAVLSMQGSNVTTIGQTLLGKFANAYEPLLEQYIGRQVIMEVTDPLDPNNRTVEYAGYLADYTSNFIALFNVEHETSQEVTITLPDIDHGDRLPPLPLPPAPGTPTIELPPPIKVENDLAIRIDGVYFHIHNTRNDPVVVRTLERQGFEPLSFGMVIPPRGHLDLPARDAHGAVLRVEHIRCLDVIALRKYAVVRYAGELVERRGIVDELHLKQLPLVPKLMDMVADRDGDSQRPEEATGIDDD